MVQPSEEAASKFARYLEQTDFRPLLLTGECEQVLAALPPESIDCVLTSPPYWGHREYAGGGLGQEPTHQAYVEHLVAVFREVKRVLKPTGSMWLNLGDSYDNKNLVGVPWRVAIVLTDTLGLTLRNDVIWHKVKGGPDNSHDKLRNIHEHVFHFVKQPKGYYYDVDAIRTTPREAKVVNGAVVSATGVTGVRYERQIELSTLSNEEKTRAKEALKQILGEIHAGRLADFRMVIRGQHRTTHSDSEKVSGRAKELQQRGYYFLKYHPNGAKPSDVWSILPEDTQGRQLHFAPFPLDLCRIPITATSPPGGIILDPFCGTGTALVVAMQMGRKSVGIDTSKEYLSIAEAGFSQALQRVEERKAEERKAEVERGAEERRAEVEAEEHAIFELMMDVSDDPQGNHPHTVGGTQVDAQAAQRDLVPAALKLELE